MWSTLLSGATWKGVIVNKRKNGSLYEEEATISPIHDADGHLIAYAAVKHDMTQENLLHENLSREERDRDTIVSLMREVRQAETVEATAAHLCELATTLDSVDAACLLLIQRDGGLVPIGISGSTSFDVKARTPFRLDQAANIDSLKGGPVIISLSPDDWPSNPGVISTIQSEGLRCIVMVPVRFQGELIGILALGTKDPKGERVMASRFGHFEELGSYAGTLLGSAAGAYERQGVIARRVREVIEGRQFRPVFQPFVDLDSGTIVGYEALTRFDDGIRPDIRFEEAHSVGLGSELEATCARASLDAARDLPRELFLSINFSPAALLDGRAAGVIAGANRQIVVEITEHTEIADYSAINKAMAQMDGVKLAVDDAGAGYTSLSHIIQLAPEFVKLDISIVRNIDTDSARRAMAAGMCHYAAESRTVIIAEGVETQAEADTLRELGVTLAEGSLLGQGYLFGRPGPLP